LDRAGLHAWYVPLVMAAGFSGQLKLAFDTFEALQAALARVAPHEQAARAATPDATAFEALIRGCCVAAQPNRARKVLAYMLELGIAPTRACHEELVGALVAAGRAADAAAHVREAASTGVHMHAATYAAVIGGLAEQRDARDALAMLRHAQAAGALRAVDASAHRGVFNVSGLPQPAVTSVLFDGLRALRRAVQSSALPPPPDLRVYHSPRDRTHVRSVLASLSPPLRARTWGVGHRHRHLFVAAEDAAAFVGAQDRGHVRAVRRVHDPDAARGDQALGDDGAAAAATDAGGASGDEQDTKRRDAYLSFTTVPRE
jgi:pentatricopeptide repeat protein